MGIMGNDGKMGNDRNIRKMWEIMGNVTLQKKFFYYPIPPMGIQYIIKKTLDPLWK